MRPLGDRILVKLDEAQAMVGLIHIPDNAQSRPRSGEVVAVGPGELLDTGKRVPMELKVGNRILIGPVTGGRELEHDGAKCVLMRERDVLAVSEE